MNDNKNKFPETDAVQGLKGQYFNNLNLSGDPILQRVDLLVDFDWYHYSPEPSLIGTNFSARWTGSITPDITVLGLIGVDTDDGARYEKFSIFLCIKFFLVCNKSHYESSRAIDM
jgi:hypothetical protein